MSYTESIKNITTDIRSIRRDLGDDGASKVISILNILTIGNPSVAYAKAILEAAGMALDRMVEVRIVDENKDN